MKLFYRIFFGYLLLAGLAGYFMIKTMQREIRPAAAQAMEDTLVDTSQLLAAIAAKEFPQVSDDLKAAIDTYKTQNPKAQIWGKLKQEAALTIYITDNHGTVLYHSSDSTQIGRNYSRWNDVYKTLNGKYGARSSRLNPNDPTTSTMHVAAPIMQHGQIAGVLTAAKAGVTIQPFISLGQRNVVWASAVLMLAALVAGGALSYWLTRSIRKLTHYADKVKNGQRANIPKISEPELASLAVAMADMRKKLEGKDYAAQYVLNLTHELKSPLSSIRAGSELLQEDLPQDQRIKFAQNITNDTKRLQDMIDRLLMLARVENQQSLNNPESINLADLIRDVLASKQTLITQSKIQVIDNSTNQMVMGDVFLLQQAISNVLDNAIAFTPHGGSIALDNDEDIVLITNTGQPIPEYALPKLFDKFFSMPRPQTQQKSSGLGLSFVREVLGLHNATIDITNVQIGVEVEIRFLT